MPLASVNKNYMGNETRTGHCFLNITSLRSEAWAEQEMTGIMRLSGDIFS